MNLLAALFIFGLTGCPVVIDFSEVRFPDSDQIQEDGQSGEALLSELEKATFDAVNDERADHGLPALRARADLSEVARQHSEDMIDRGFFNHVNPDGEDPFDRLRDAGVTYNIAGENIAWNNHPNAAEVAVEGWMESEGHRENMLRESFTHTGVGVATSEDGRHFFTQVFIGASKSVPDDQIHIYYYAP